MALWELGAKRILSLVSAGEVSAQDVLESYLARIEEVDPKIGAYVEVFEPEARLAAARIDSMILTGEDPGILAGLPCAVKDNISLKGQSCTAGSRILEGYVSPLDAVCAENLKRKGAVFLGRTNMDEFAMGCSTETSVYGVTANPWDTHRAPGGSSGGSAAAVAAGMAPVSLGTDTGGSIRQPAAFNGLCGLKPTYGLVSRDGVVAFASSLDHVGPIGETVWDCALLLEAMVAGPDTQASKASQVSQGRSSVRYSRALERSVKGLRAGVPAELMTAGISRGVMEQFNHALKTLSSMGVIIEETSLPSLDYVVDVYYIIASSEASSNLGRYDGGRYGKRANRANLDDMYLETRSLMGKEVKRRIILGTFALSSGNYEDCYLRAARVRTKVIVEFEEAFHKYHVLLSPAAPSVAFPLGGKPRDILEVYAADCLTIPANLAGIPALSVPCGLTVPDDDPEGRELPCGLQIMGKPFDEETVLSLGHAFEMAQGGRIQLEMAQMRRALSGLKECEPVG